MELDESELIDSRKKGFGKVAGAKQDAGYDWCDGNMLLFKNQETLRMEGGKVKSGYEATLPFKGFSIFPFFSFKILAENQQFHPQTFHTKAEQKRVCCQRLKGNLRSLERLGGAENP